MTEIEQLLIKLINIPSPSGQEKNIGEFIIQQLKGFKLRKQNVARNRFNIIAKKGVSKKWLVAHMDTIPGNIPINVTKDSISGRGACDNKQSIAASILVGKKLDNINILFTVGEEEDFAGARKAQKTRIVQGDLVIIQEPTQFQIMTGQRGVITCTIQTKGICQHSRFDKHNSAIHKLIQILNNIQKKKWTACNIGLIQGGVAANVVADNAEATLVIRPKNIKEHHQILNDLKKIRANTTIKNNFEPKINQLGFPIKIAKGFSEMAFFKNSIEFGAGNIKYAHTDHEHISRKDLNALLNKLTQLLE